MRTGREIYLDIWTQITAYGLATNSFPPNVDGSFTLGGNKYYNAYLYSHFIQPRQKGWFHLSTSRLEYMLPANDPFRSYLKDTHDDIAAAAPSWPAYVATVNQNAANLDGALEDDGVFTIWCPWMQGYKISSVMMDAWRGDRPNMVTLAQWIARLFIWFWDDTRGGSSYYADDFGEGGATETTDPPSTTNNIIQHCLPDVASCMSASGRTTGQPSTKMVAGQYGGDSNGLIPYGTQLQAGLYLVEKRLCTLAMMLAAGITDPNNPAVLFAQDQYNQIFTRLGHTAPMNSAMFNYNASNGACPQWCIVPPPS
jgi:hypothetical protein